MIRMLAAGIAAACLAAPAVGQSWPAKPLRLVIGFAAGGSVDLVGRIVAPRLAELLAHPVIIETRAGAGGNIAGELVARAVPLRALWGALGVGLLPWRRPPVGP